MISRQVRQRNERTTIGRWPSLRRISSSSTNTPNGRSRCLPRWSGAAYAFEPFNVTRAAFSNVERPGARLYFNQASPSAYVRGNTRAVPLALAYMRTLERQRRSRAERRRRVRARTEQERQATLLRTLGIDTPLSITFNDPRGAAALRDAASSGRRC